MSNVVNIGKIKSTKLFDDAGYDKHKMTGINNAGQMPNNNNLNVPRKVRKEGEFLK